MYVFIGHPVTRVGHFPTCRALASEHLGNIETTCSDGVCHDLYYVHSWGWLLSWINGVDTGFMHEWVKDRNRAEVRQVCTHAGILTQGLVRNNSNNVKRGHTMRKLVDLALFFFLALLTAYLVGLGSCVEHDTCRPPLQPTNTSATLEQSINALDVPASPPLEGKELWKPECSAAVASARAHQRSKCFHALEHVREGLNQMFEDVLGSL